MRFVFVCATKMPLSICTVHLHIPLVPHTEYIYADHDPAVIDP